MSQFTPAGGGGSTVTVADTAVQVPTILNLPLPTANTEVATALAIDTKRFWLRARGRGWLKLAYTLGESGTRYVSIPPGGFYSEAGLGGAVVTLYLQSPTAGELVELLSWA